VSPVPPLNLDLHLVLCDFGRSGLAYVETDPAQADATTIVRNLLRGEYDRPLRIIAVNAEEEWSRDVSESIAAKVQDVAEHEARELTSGTLAFIDAHLAHARQPTLPLLPSLWPPCCELARLSFAAWSHPQKAARRCEPDGGHAACSLGGQVAVTSHSIRHRAFRVAIGKSIVTYPLIEVSPDSHFYRITITSTPAGIMLTRARHCHRRQAQSGNCHSESMRARVLRTIRRSQ
jgi:hypothetical protein